MPKKNESGLETQVAVIGTKVDNIEEKVTNIEKKLEGHYVTKDEFEPIKKIVYGMVGLILVAVVGALLALVIINP